MSKGVLPLASTFTNGLSLGFSRPSFPWIGNSRIVVEAGSSYSYQTSLIDLGP